MEKKHYILLDITRTLLYEMHVLHYLWFDAVMIATYLHNWLPSFHLGGQFPLLIFPHASLFLLPLRVFGRSLFIHDCTPSLSKLIPRVLKGVFVGYLCTKKGYHVYFHDVRCFISSIDVTFHEDVPYFSPSTAPLRASVSPPIGFPSIPPSLL